MPLAIIDIPKLLGLKDKDIEKPIARYLKVTKKEEKPKFKLLTEEQFKSKIKEADSILKSCTLCERKCMVNRTKTTDGFCKLGKDMMISSYFEHHGEEQFFIPSFTIFFWSCNFSCQYCQNWSISQRKGMPSKVSEDELAEIIDGKSVHSKNISLVGGEPTMQIPSILKTLSKVKSDIPIIWNSNMYMSEKSMELLKGVVDVYLSDFKYGNNECAERLSKVDNYIETVSRNHLLAFQDAELVIRHLVLPGHVECCTKPILDWIAANLGRNVSVNLMDQYKPEYHAVDYPEIRGYLSSKEFNQAVAYAKKLKLNVIY